MSAPFMQLYVADYLGDTRHLTTEQHGAYLLLLMAMWRSDGSLPDDGRKLARIVGCTPSRWAKIAPEVMEFFDIRDGVVTSGIFEAWDRERRRLAGRRPLSAETRAFILERDGYRCTYCDSSEGPMEVDHVLAVSRGGSDDFENLVCACRPCNRSKAARLLADWVPA